MSIKIKAIERGQPGVQGGGTKKYYASAQTSGEMTLNKMTKAVEKISTASGADIRAVIYALMDVMRDSLADGQIIRLGELGSLRVSISSEGEDTADKVSAASVKNAKVIFTPSKELKDMLKTLDFEKI
jgi:predicted histone-like DNA-binding protein